ncbi:hypothetical protein N9A81_01480 [Synechococcus sp. AH-707-M23]|nr:hypothetical protein [Synechococcus sp. AH-707-M23]
MADPVGPGSGGPGESDERIIQTDLRKEMSRSYLEYAMSVIVGRALPDARDGLKPVHRRILYAMYELGLTSDRPYRKCARVVGEVLGKYHPHGDTAVYDALVRMAQDFSMSMPLIDGHGNFGSVDNDPPAAMRYTESRLQALTTDSLLEDIEAETVDFADNFDGSQQEPTVLPSRIPQLLLNGSAGIAVGMATNIPPHNLGELITSLLAVSEFNDDTDLLMLTTGGYIKRTRLSAFSNIRSNGLIAIGLEEGDALTWVRLAVPGDSVLIGSRAGMTIHFRLNDNELRPLGRTARGVRSMNLRAGDSLVSMDVLPVELADQIAASSDEGDEGSDEGDTAAVAEGPWVLVASASGLGKRVPVTQFRLQKRAGMGLRAMKFRTDADELVGLRVLGAGEELLLVSEKGVIVRTSADAIPQQSRAATGVRLQRLDKGDRLADVVLVPPEAEMDDDNEASAEESSEPSAEG